MQRTLIILSLAGLAACVSPAVQAQNPKEATITRKSGAKATNGVIDQESARGIKVTGAADVIPAEDIADVNYENQIPVQLRIEVYRPAAGAETLGMKETDRAKRDAKLAEAIAKYETALPKIPAGLAQMRRHIEFKIGYLRGLIGQGGDPQSRILAIAKLKEFTKNHPDSWQLTPALMMLASLQAESGDLEAAQETFDTLAKSNVSDSVKQKAQLQRVRFVMNAGKHGEAIKDLQGLITALPKNSEAQMSARLAEAECLAALNQLDAATKKLESFLDEISDKDMKARGFNTLGECYYRADKLHEARWQFLWVDVIYNQDAEQHAKALFYLYTIFSRLSDFERAENFYEALTTNERFASSAYRQRAVEDRKKRAT